MEKPVLVVMAAGMGSRYGGLKQLDPVGPSGQIILDYSIYDAHRAGFETVIFVIKPEHEGAFRAGIGQRFARSMDVKYVHQKLDDLPVGYCVPEGREKPWGTCHAVLAARDAVKGPFAVINADDYYGPQAYGEIYRYLVAHPDGNGLYEYAMVGYLLKNTVTQAGSVARGVCVEDEAHYLASVTERTSIEKHGEHARFTQDGGKTWTALPGETIVSMNFFGFTQSFLREAQARFPAFLDGACRENPLKGEYFLPGVVSQLTQEGLARVQVLRSRDKWYGVTYQADRETVVEALAAKTAAGEYPEKM